MKKTQSGFTLIELVVVIVLLGILGVTALGKFQNLSADAADAAVQGIAAELSSASAINFAASVLDNATGTAITNANCAGPSATLNSLMASGIAPTDSLTYAIATGGDITVEGNACAAAGDTFNCSISHSKGSAAGSNAVAAIICTGTP